MIYLDYSATTPVDERVLDSYIKVTRDFIANPNSIHALGQKSKELLIASTNQIAEYFDCDPKEIIYTSSASESNSMAIKGVALKYFSKGKHIITSKLEHKSVLDTMEYLSAQGFKIDYVNILSNGQIDLKHLEELVNDETILVSICGVNSEVGYRAPLKTIRQVINRKNKSCLLHSDLTQALGKVKFFLSDIDLASFSSHKIYAPKGIGILYKKKSLELDPMIFGTTTNSPYRGGTPMLPLIASFAKAIRIAYDSLDTRYNKCEKLRDIIIKGLFKYDIHVNSNNLCVPHILNISLKHIKSQTFVMAMSKYEVYLSTNTACSSNEESTVLNEIHNNDKTYSQTSIRISLSHLTTMDEVNKFLKIFDKVWNELLNK